jgi:hypothetical protein
MIRVKRQVAYWTTLSFHIKYESELNTSQDCLMHFKEDLSM